MIVECATYVQGRRVEVLPGVEGDAHRPAGSFVWLGLRVPDESQLTARLERTVVRARSLSGLLDAALTACLTQITVQQNEDMRRISAWVAMAAAPTLLAGIYGMNFQHVPELGYRYGYPAVLVAMLLIALTMHRLFRRSGWL